MWSLQSRCLQCPPRALPRSHGCSKSAVHNQSAIGQRAASLLAFRMGTSLVGKLGRVRVRHATHQSYTHSGRNWRDIKVARRCLNSAIERTHDIASITNLVHRSVAPTIEPNIRYTVDLLFNKDAVAWAHKPYTRAKSPFRIMLICQPPVVAVEMF